MLVFAAIVLRYGLGKLSLRYFEKVCDLEIVLVSELLTVILPVSANSSIDVGTVNPSSAASFAAKKGELITPPVILNKVTVT